MAHWVRTGDCPPERCQGRCCSVVGLWFSNADAGFLSLMRARGVKVLSGEEQSLVAIPQRCQFLTQDNLCALHPAMKPSPELPKRPEFCDDWPTDPAQLVIHPECGYTFTLIEEQTDLDSSALQV